MSWKLLLANPNKQLILENQNIVMSVRIDSIEARAQEEREFRIRLVEGIRYLVNDRKGTKPDLSIP